MTSESYVEQLSVLKWAYRGVWIVERDVLLERSATLGIQYKSEWSANMDILYFVNGINAKFISFYVS